MDVKHENYSNASLAGAEGRAMKQFREYQWGYYPLVEKVDREIAKVLKALRESGVIDMERPDSGHGYFCIGQAILDRKFIRLRKLVTRPKLQGIQIGVL